MYIIIITDEYDLGGTVALLLQDHLTLLIVSHVTCIYASLLSMIVFFKTSGQSNLTTSSPHSDGSVVFDWLRKCAPHLIHGSLDSPDLAF